MKKYLVLCLLIATVSACDMLATPAEDPAIAFPEAWRQAEGVTPGAAVNPPTEWWKDFQDAELNTLVSMALAKNNDLAGAVLNLKRAQLQLDIARDAQLPTLGAGLSASRSVALDNGQQSRSYGLSASVGYELDIWNRAKNAKDVASFEATATAQDLESVRQTLIHTVATLYWQIALNAEQIKDAKSSLAYTQRSLDLAKANHLAGAVSGLDVAAANQSVTAQKAGLEQLQQISVELNNALALLMGQAPGSVVTTITALPKEPMPAIAGGLPADILSRRPDLAAARLRLQESLLGVDISKAALLPGISLTSNIGTSSVALSDILLNPVAALGAGISLPFLQWTQKNANIETAKIDYEKAVIGFRQTVYKALGEVDNALSAREQLKRQEKLLLESLADAEKAEKINAALYKAGSSPIQVLLDAQERTRRARMTVLDNRYSRLLNHAALCLALGGSAVDAGHPKP